MSGTVIAVASGKGGVGKTTTVVNIGEWLHADGESVVLVDGDLGMPNLETLLPVDSSVTIHEILAGETSVTEAETTTESGLAVLGGEGSIDAYADADPAQFGQVLSRLAERYDYVLVDTGAGLSYESLLPLGLVDEIVLVSSPDESAVNDTKRTAEFARTVDGAIRGVIVTRVRDTTDPLQIGETLETEVLGVVPEDPIVSESTAAGKPLREFSPDSSVSASYHHLSKVLIRDASPEIPDKFLEVDSADEPSLDEPSTAQEHEKEEHAAAQEEEAPPENTEEKHVGEADVDSESASRGFFGRFLGRFR